MRHGHIAIDLLLPAACALTIDGAFSKRMGILQKEVKARQQVVYEDTAMCQSLFLRPFASLLSSQYFWRNYAVSIEKLLVRK